MVGSETRGERLDGPRLSRRAHAGSGLSADVAIVGTGLVAAVFARVLLERGARVVMLDGGGQASVTVGGHLRNAFACRVDALYYQDLVRTHLRYVSTPPESSAPRPSSAFRGARVTSVLGGMGTLWNCVAPRFHATERWPGISANEWNVAYAEAERMLSVGTALTAASRRPPALQRILAQRYGARGSTAPRPAPLAARPDPQRGGRPRWTGPGEVLGAAAEEASSGRLRIYPQHVVRRLRHRSGRVSHAEVTDLESGSAVVVNADTFVVAGGAIRTPALLWSSGIQRDAAGRSPLGRYLCDHPLAYAEVAVGGDVLAEGDPDPCIQIPLAGSRPFNSLVLAGTADTESGDIPVRQRRVSLWWYSLAHPVGDNRLVFRPKPNDPWGLPRVDFEYRLPDSDSHTAREALQDLVSAAEMLGTVVLHRPPQILSSGSSMHTMGTTRTGLIDDGASVTDLRGRVWGFLNLYLAGTGLIPSASATNPTLTACALAARTARSV